MEIDWNKVIDNFSLWEDAQYPEGVIHEIAHAYDCLGSAVLSIPYKLGNQAQAEKIIQKRYPKQARGVWSREAAKHEIRVSAITFGVLKALEIDYRRDSILEDINLPKLKPEIEEDFTWVKRESLFDIYCLSTGEAVDEMATFLRKFPKL